MIFPTENLTAENRQFWLLYNNYDTYGSLFLRKLYTLIGTKKAVNIIQYYIFMK